MIPKLIAFDLDGTLLTSDKRISKGNLRALREMTDCGVRLALASGRLGSSMSRVVDGLDIPLAMMTLNGAMVYNGPVSAANLVYSAPLASNYADELVDFACGKDFAINYYIDDKLHSVYNSRTKSWIDVYYGQTRTPCVYMDDLNMFRGRSPAKLIFIGPRKELDDLEKMFRARWAGQVYVCRTWDYYLEFLDIKANKGLGLAALAKSCGCGLHEAAAFGDAENDIPMLEACRMGAAMKNATDEVKSSAARVTEYTNDEDGVAREWERMKNDAGL
jgi:Cof subfamily protein (haloacid dehalogenase superfamily)